MRILLDECVHERFRNSFSDHDCQTADARPAPLICEGSLSVLFPPHPGSRRSRPLRTPKTNPRLPPLRYNACMSESPAERMQCMEVWGGSQTTSSGVELDGLDVWVYSKPFGEAHQGGDVYDVSGHGKSVASTAADLRTLMRRFVNHLDQKIFVRLLNEQFTALSGAGSF